MVQFSEVQAALTSIVTDKPFVAVIVGGTSGMGEYTVRSLAKLHAQEGRLRVYIVGRNIKAAEKTIADCRGICVNGKFVFVRANDLSLLKDVDRVCSEITKMEGNETTSGAQASVDLLVMSQACSIFQKQKDTAEGLDFLMSLMYYSRMRFIVSLLPLLVNSTLPGGARAISVYAAGTEDKLILNDLSLRDPSSYGYFQARSHITYMTTVVMETIADQNPGKLSLTHLFPGLVLTPAFQDPTIPWWFRILWGMMSPFMSFVAIPPEVIGQRILFLATSRYPAKGTQPVGDVEVATGTDSELGSGAYSIGQKSETLPTSKGYKSVDKAQLKAAAWEHTMKVFEVIEAGGKFTG